jgi:hypothetical protein
VLPHILAGFGGGDSQWSADFSFLADGYPQGSKRLPLLKAPRNPQPEMVLTRASADNYNAARRCVTKNISQVQSVWISRGIRGITGGSVHSTMWID